MNYKPILRQLTDYERFCYKVVDCIKFTKKHGHRAKGIYLDYEGSLIKLNAKNEENITYGELQDYVVITQNELYPFTNNIKESNNVSFASWIKHTAIINNTIEDKNIVIRYDLLTYEERINIQNILDKYIIKINYQKSEDMSEIYGYKAK